MPKVCYDGFCGSSSVSADYEKLKSRQEDLMAMSQATAASLQSQLTSKDVQLRKYQDMLQRAKETELEQTELLQREIRRLNTVVDELTEKKNLLLRKLDVLEGEHTQQPDSHSVAPSSAAMFTAEDLEQAISEKEKEIIHLSAKLHRAETKVADLSEQLASMNSSSDSFGTRCTRLEQLLQEKGRLLDIASEELELAYQQLKSVESDVRRLNIGMKEKNDELKSKSEREIALTHALHTVKEEMMKEVARLAYHKHDGYEYHGRHASYLVAVNVRQTIFERRLLLFKWKWMPSQKSFALRYLKRIDWNVI